MQAASKANSDSLPHSSALRLRWIVTCRIIFLILLIPGMSLYSEFGASKAAQSPSFESLISVPIALLIFSLLSWTLLRPYEGKLAFVCTQFLIDSLFITDLVYISGGTASPFLFLYLPLTMAAALLLSRAGALLVSGLNGTLYTALAFALQYKLLIPADGNIHAQLPQTGLALQITGLCSAMVLTSIATSYLLKAASVAGQQAEQSRMDLAKLSRQQSSLINSIPKGIVTTQVDGRISNINQAALELLGIREEDYLAKPLSALMSIISPKFSALKPDEAVPKDLMGEFELNTGDNFPLKISFHSTPVVSAEGEVCGCLVIFQDVTELRNIEEQLALQDRMARLLARTEIVSEESSQFLDELVGESKVMQKIFALIERVAPSDATVLIQGESGTGKELVARAIHRRSKRSDGPFVAVNCGAIPENLIESELFGHKKGSFTGAHADAIGLFRQAQSGTIFLDEIGELPISLQAKLLRSLQERTVHPVGGERDIPIDVRIIAATNRNLKQDILANRFREDLYYRLNVISVNLPPLRDRKEDIPLLSHALLKRLVGKDTQAIMPPQTMQLLSNYYYPGNVRELENILERAYVLGGEVILPEHLPESLRNSSQPQSLEALEQFRIRGGNTQIIIDDSIELPANLDLILSSIERKYLEVALLQSDGVKKKAAELLGINFRSLRYRLQKFGISED